MKKATKLMSLLLALAMLFALTSTAAFAEETKEPDGQIKEVLLNLSEKFLKDPVGSIDKVDKLFTIVDVGEDVVSILYHIDRMKDTAEDARFEAEALGKKIKFDLDNIGKPDDPIGEAQLEIDLFIDRENHEKAQINEDIDNINKLTGFLGEKTGKDIPAIPHFEYEPVDVQLKPIIEGTISNVLKGILGR